MMRLVNMRVGDTDVKITTNARKRKWSECMMPERLARLPKVCPHCDSKNVKFWMYSNYKLEQPRYKCLDCQRSYTLGGRINHKSSKVKAGEFKNAQTLSAMIIQQSQEIRPVARKRKVKSSSEVDGNKKQVQIKDCQISQQDDTICEEAQNSDKNASLSIDKREEECIPEYEGDCYSYVTNEGGEEVDVIVYVEHSTSEEEDSVSSSDGDSEDANTHIDTTKTLIEGSCKDHTTDCNSEDSTSDSDSDSPVSATSDSDS